MQLMTFNEILTVICDNFDDLISPRSIARSNTNIIYLIFKAVAKGYELINNICVVLSNKFNPLNCSEEDLYSVASLVGTEFLKGSGSGLDIIVTNSGEFSAKLYEGTYTYHLDDDISFVFEVQESIIINSKESINVIAMSNKIGSYYVTAQSSIDIDTESITDNLKFSCLDNANLLGIPDETSLEFRKRILSDDTRQNSIVELQTKLRNLPYLFDCKCKYNNTEDTIVYDEITIPSGYLAIFYSGALRNEIAEVIASKILCSTVETEDSIAVSYENQIFANGIIKYNMIPFKKEQFNINVKYKFNPNIISEENAQVEISSILYKEYTPQVHIDYIKENEVYNVLNSVDINGVEILGVDLLLGGNVVDYIEVPVSRIPELKDVTFN